MKKRVLKKIPTAYCVKLSTPVNGNNYIVWPGKVQPRGFGRPAIGFGKTARQAWESVRLQAK